MFVKANDIRKGYVLKFRDRVVRVLSATHHTPGNLRAMVQAEMKDVSSGTNVSHRFRSDDMVEKLTVDFTEMEYLYSEGDSLVFMNTSNYEQVNLPTDFVGAGVGYLLPNSKVTVNFIDGKPVSIDLPPRVTLKVIETEPGIRNATATNVSKPAKLETGITVPVPAFVNEGDSIVVNTETGEYMSRG